MAESFVHRVYVLLLGEISVLHLERRPHSQLGIVRVVADSRHPFAFHLLRQARAVSFLRPAVYEDKRDDINVC